MLKEYSLEKEFEIFKILHKTTVLQAKLTQFYKDFNETGITIPVFMQKDDAEEKAKAEVSMLLTNNIEVFEELYNKAWQEVAELLP